MRENGRRASLADGIASRPISNDERHLLVGLLSESPTDGTGVDSVGFRARHHKQLALLDRLETERLIRKDQDRYFVSLVTLARIDHELAHRVLAMTESLYEKLRSKYLLEPRRPVPLEELAEATKLSIGDTRQTLLHMLESPAWCAGHSKLLSSPGAHLLIAEGVLRFETFRSLIDQLEEWRADSLHQHQRWGTGGPPGMLGDPDNRGQKPVSQSRKPPWFDSLPPDIGEIMAEVYAAIDTELRALPAMGIRAALDMLFVKLLAGDHGTFEQKVNALCAKELLSASERDHVLATIDAGNASAHRGHIPDRTDVQTILVVCERLLQSHFVLPEATRRLRTNTPQRATRKRTPP